MFSIKKIAARQIFDSRGNPTIEADVYTETGFGRASVPSGASTGKYEALELRDNKKQYLGKGVLKAVSNVNRMISKEVLGMDCRNQAEIDNTMIRLDGTENKSVLGANAILAVSLAACRAAANTKKIPLYKHISEIAGMKKQNEKNFLLPVPFMNIINGGKHAGNNLAIQEFMIVPKAETFAEAMKQGTETYHTLKEIILKKYGKNAVNVGDEGGFAPPLDKTEDALKLIEEAISKAGYKGKVQIAIDAAASEFYQDKAYFVDEKKHSETDMINFYKDLIKKYSIISIEDPFEEDAFDSFAKLNREIGKKVQIVADDLTVTNISRVETAIAKKSCSTLLLKVNQIGTLTQGIEAAKLAMQSGMNVMVSHRSGETEDSFIADLAVGLRAGQIKSGAPCRSERLAKYNQLLRIEEELRKKSKFNNV